VIELKSIADLAKIENKEIRNALTELLTPWLGQTDYSAEDEGFASVLESKEEYNNIYSLANPDPTVWDGLNYFKKEEVYEVIIGADIVEVYFIPLEFLNEELKGIINEQRETGFLVEYEDINDRMSNPVQPTR